MKMLRIQILAAVLLALPMASAPVLAESPEQAPIPPLPEEDHYDDLVDMEGAEVVIRRTDEGRVREFRRNGQTYMIEVHPDNAPPYHIVDHDGDGDPTQRHEGPYDPVNLPRWVLFRW